MAAEGGKKIKAIVAVSAAHAKTNVLPPCGVCRHFISHFGNPWIIISSTKKARLDELYPMPVR